MSNLPYYADAVEAEHICDEETPRAKGKKWRVAFYRNQRLYAVINIPFSRGAAERFAASSNASMEAAIENYIRSVAGVLK